VFNTLVQAFKNPELRKRIYFTLLAFVVFRIMTFMTVPLVNSDVLTGSFSDDKLFGFANALTGGALQQFSIIALGISPYITASIVIQLLQMDIIPVLSDWAKEGETGKQKINQLTRYVALGMAFLQALALSIGFDKLYGGAEGLLTVSPVKPIVYVYIAIIMTAGTAALLWLSDQITIKGIGNGTSMIIMAGIVSAFPGMIRDLLRQYVYPSFEGKFSFDIKEWLIFLAVILVMVIIILAVIFMQNATRKIPIQYANRANSASLQGKKDSHLPIKLNPSGVIPVIFASSLMSLPLTFASFIQNANVKGWLTTIFSSTEPIGFVLYVLLIYLFSFFYSFIQVSPEKISENLRKQGSYIPGVRPGKETENYVSGVLLRTTVVGATYLMIIAILPILFSVFTPLPPSVQIGGTSLLIVVGVAQETFKQLETKTKQKKYSGFIK
jgi:preprotein translocase subunit SecY